MTTGIAGARARLRGVDVWRLVLGLVLSAAAAVPAHAQLVQAPDTYAGDLWSRPRLSGDWGGHRDQLAKRGVVLDVDWLQVLQGVGSGGRDTGVEYGGSVDYTLQLDTHRLGLWPGGLLKAHAETSHGRNVNKRAGALGAVNGDALFPVADESTTTLTNLTYMQFLAKWVGIIVGKLEAYDGDANEFADDHRTKFLNVGLDFNLVNMLTPISAWGGGVVLVPWEGALVTAAVLDPNGRPDDLSLDDVFEDGVTVAAEGRVTFKPFGLLGHQLVGMTWSNKERLSLEQDPSNIARFLLFQRFPRLQDPGPVLRRILERFFPALLLPVAPLERKSETWSVYYNFDQYLWQSQADPKQGIGIFFRFGLSDGNPNPVKYHYNVGVGGRGLIPGRPRDTYGVGWSRIEFSDHFFAFLRQRLSLGLSREDTVEAFYNAALTAWLNVSLDLQVVDPGLDKTPSGRSLVDMDTAVVGGLRVHARF